jgi:dipeptidyl aminopeptidase/acylaminoacyl peptidase
MLSSSLRLFVIVILAVAGGIATAGERFTPKHVASMRSAGSAMMSPDASHVAYLLLVPRDPYADDFEDGPPWGELHVVRLSDDSDHPFISGQVNIEAIKWSGDSKSIYFLAKRGKDKHKCLYKIPLEGGEAVRVLSHDEDISSFSLAPDEKRVAFIAEKEAGKEKEKLKKKGFAAEIYEEDYQPELVWVSELGDKAVKPKSLELEGSASELHWSPTGDRLAVGLAPTPLIDDEYMKRKVNVVDVAAGKVVQRIENPGKLGDVRWSPDGAHLAMISAEDIHDPSPGRLLVADVETGSLKDVLPKLEGHIGAIAWQDNDTVMFVSDEGLRTAFGKVDIDGSNKKIIVAPEDGPVMTSLTLSKDGMSGAFVASTPQFPGEVFAMKHGETSLRRVTDSNPWLKNMEFARQEGVTFKARDGQTIQGVLIHPLEEQKGQAYPFILCVHGGPEAHESNGWLTNYSRPGQVATANGYAVFYPNYRGSTGRGVAFSKLGQGDEAGKEFDDLVDAVDYFVGTGLADKSKVGITGGSYGGYASAWGATAQSEHFAASVMFVGISDTLSKKGTTDIPNEDFLVHTLAKPWDDEGKWKFFLERSPIYHAKKSHTPILILAGKADTRVHPSQSMELYRHLKTLNQAPVRLVFYPGEQHGNRKAAARLDYNIRMMQWFDHYLKGPGGKPPAMEVDYGLKKKEKEDE